LAPEEFENVYKNNRPGYAEGRKKINAVVHYKLLSLFFKNHVVHDFVDFRYTHF
jgi:hypothetical protein